MNKSKPKPLEPLYGAEAVRGVLSVAANVPVIPRFPVAYRLERVESQQADTPITITYEVDDFETDVRTPGGKFFRRVDENTLYYESPVGSFGSLRLKLTWHDQHPRVTVNPTYHRLGRIGLGTVHAAGQNVRDVANVALLRNGYALLHCAGITFKDKTALLVGLSNTGKTTSVMEFVRHHGASFLGDDLVVVDRQNAFACPLTRANVNPSEAPSLGYRTYQAFRRSIPLWDNVVYGAQVPIRDFLGAENVTTNQRVTHIFFLMNENETLCEPVAQDDAVRLLLASNQTEFTHNTSQVLWAGEYLGAGVPAVAAAREEQSIMEAITEQAENICLRGNPAYFKQEIEKVLF